MTEPAPAAPPLGPRAALPLAVLLTGCSALVAPGNDPAPCVVGEDGDPCPPGQTCVEGFCAVSSVDAGCVRTDELCNGLDDDCDGNIDEGQDFDGDGFTWCGGGVLAERDCDDNDPGVFPGRGDVVAAAEVCDGKDNDCDGTIDNDTGDGTLCPAGEACVPGRGCRAADCTIPGRECGSDEFCDVTVAPPMCVTGADCSIAGCDAGLVCDEDSGACVEEKPLGAPCVTDTECEDGAVCVDGAALRLPNSAPARVCARSCCDDTECGDGAICWISGTGARACIPPALVLRERGTGGPLADCVDDADCASGVCTDRLCLGNCVGSDTCPDPYGCALRAIDQGNRRVAQMACTLTAGAGAGATCLGGSRDCESSLCLDVGFGLCSAACATTADCPDLTTRDMYCGFGGVVNNGVVDQLQICLFRAHDGRGRQGDPCVTSEDCNDLLCFRGRCADTCCNDASCPDDTSCRPVLAGQRWEMHCIPQGA